MRFDVITIFPHLIEEYCKESLLGKAQKKNFLKVHAVDLRDFTFDRHRTVDDTPYGGGPGMVMRVEPVARAVEAVKKFKIKNDAKRHPEPRRNIGVKDLKRKVILLSPRGTQFDQKMAKRFARLDQLIFICGRYEGVDERVSKHVADEEISVGPYVLAGGELGALIIIEAVSRLIPGVLGNKQSLKEETFSLKDAAGEYPHYTRPPEFKGWKAPAALLSGNHAKIKAWREKKIKSK